MIYVGEQGNVIYDNSLPVIERKNYVALKELPVVDIQSGKKAQIKADLANQVVFFEYVDLEVEKESDIFDFTVDGLKVDELIDVLKWRGAL